MIFGENRKMSKEEKLGKNRVVAAAKGTFAVEKFFTAAKAASSQRGRGARKAPPQVRQGVALLRRGEVLRRSKGTIH